MTTYATPGSELTIFFGPGAVHLSGDEGVGWVSADVGVKLTYESHAPGATRAVIELVAEQIDPAGWGNGPERSSSREVHVQAELTEGDLQVLAGTIDALLVAIKEDDTRERAAERRGERVGD